LVALGAEKSESHGEPDQVEMDPIGGFSRSLRGMTPKACDQPMPFGVDLLTSQDIAAGHAGETPRR